MAKEFFYQVMGDVFGPIPGVQLRELAVAGDVTPETLVRVGEEGEWVMARRLTNLFDEHGRGIPHQEYMKAMSISSAMAFREVPHSAPSEKLLDAIAYMSAKHAGQLRKDGQTPYSSHPMRVVAILMLGFGVDDEDILTAAALHDIIEDTTGDFDEISERFGEKVAQYVAALSKDPRSPEPERERAYMKQLVRAPVAVKLCKLADAYDNLVSCQELPKKQQMKTIRKADALVQKFAEDMPPQWEPALDLLRGLIEKTSGGLIHHD